MVWKKKIDVFPFCYQTLQAPENYPFHNVNHFLKGRPLHNLWVYEYDVRSKVSTLNKLNDLNAYREKQSKLKTNFHQLLFRQSFRERLKKLVLLD